MVQVDELPKPTLIEVTRPRESAHTRRLYAVILALVIAVVVPLYIYREMLLIAAAVKQPVSTAIFFGKPFDVKKMIQRLNPNGKPVYLHEVLAGVEGGCAANTGNSLPFPRGKPTAATFLVDNAERHAVVYVPTTYPDASNISIAESLPSVPLMVLFHGLNDNCEHFLDVTGFIPYAEKSGMVIVSACGSQGYLGTAWNSGMCCGFSDDQPNDIGFAQLIVTEISKAVCVNAEKVLAVGFSNGAMLAEVLACEATDVYRAVVSIGGVVELRPGNADGLAKCTAAAQASGKRTSVLMVHGTSDIMVPWGGNAFLGFPAVEANLAAWATRNGCVIGNESHTIHTKTFSNVLYGDCQVTNSGDEERTAMKRIEVEAPEAVAQVAVLNAEPQEEVALEVPVLKKDDDDEQHHGLHHHKHHHGKKNRRHAKKDRENDKKKHDDDDDADDEDEKTTNKRDDEDREEHHRGKHGDGDDVDKKHKFHARGPRRGHDHDHDHDHGHGHGHSHGQPCPPRFHPKEHREKAAALPCPGHTQVELVRVEGGGHRWPENKEFSTTDYIMTFADRVFMNCQ